MNDDDQKLVGSRKPMDNVATRTRKPGTRPARLSRDVQARLGQQLRAIYDEVVNQGVPEKFATLLNKIDAQKDK
jgi:hypothetical protein